MYIVYIVHSQYRITKSDYNIQSFKHLSKTYKITLLFFIFNYPSVLSGALTRFGTVGGTCQGLRICPPPLQSRGQGFQQNLKIGSRKFRILNGIQHKSGCVGKYTKIAPNAHHETYSRCASFAFQLPQNSTQAISLEHFPSGGTLPILQTTPLSP